jgi:hypothetical protein
VPRNTQDGYADGGNRPSRHTLGVKGLWRLRVSPLPSSGPGATKALWAAVAAANSRDAKGSAFLGKRRCGPCFEAFADGRNVPRRPLPQIEADIPRQMPHSLPETCHVSEVRFYRGWRKRRSRSRQLRWERTCTRLRVLSLSPFILPQSLCSAESRAKWRVGGVSVRGKPRAGLLTQTYVMKSRRAGTAIKMLTLRQPTGTKKTF